MDSWVLPKKIIETHVAVVFLGLDGSHSFLVLQALQIHGSRPDVVEALANQCLQHLDAVFSALGEVNPVGVLLRSPFIENMGGKHLNMGQPI